MKNKFGDKDYKLAVQRVLKRESTKLDIPKKEISVEEATENLRKRLKEVSDKILNGEMDEEIEKEIKLIQQERKESMKKQGEER